MGGVSDISPLYIVNVSFVTLPGVKVGKKVPIGLETLPLIIINLKFSCAGNEVVFMLSDGLIPSVAVDRELIPETFVAFPEPSWNTFAGVEGSAGSVA